MAGPDRKGAVCPVEDPDHSQGHYWYSERDSFDVQDT